MLTPLAAAHCVLLGLDTPYQRGGCGFWTGRITIGTSSKS